MADVRNSTSNMSYIFSDALQRYMLERALPLLVHEKFAQVKGLGSNKQKQVKFIRYNSLPAATTPLTEGVTPDGQSLAFTSFTVDLVQYGSVVKFTDVLLKTHEDDLIQVASELLGEQAGQTKDELVRDVLNAGTNVVYSGGAADRASVSAPVSATELKAARRILDRNNAKKITSFVKPSQGYNTTPLPPSYVAITHPDIVFTLQSLSGWRPVETYYSQGGLIDEGEVGAWNNIRFIATTNAKIWAGAGSGGVDVYSILVMGARAYGVVKHDALGFASFYEPLGSAGEADPLHQRAAMGWKMMTASAILNDDFIVRIECAAE